MLQTARAYLRRARIWAVIGSRTVATNEQIPQMPDMLGSNNPLNQPTTIPVVEQSYCLHRNGFESTVKPVELEDRIQGLFGRSGENLKSYIFQTKTNCDMSVWSYDGSVEREKLGKQLISLFTEMREQLTVQGHWCDFVDPLSGMPYHTTTSTDILTEVDEDITSFSSSLDLVSIGCCRALQHTEWGFNVFVGVLFTDAPTADIDAAAKVAQQKLENVLA